MLRLGSMLGHSGKQVGWGEVAMSKSWEAGLANVPMQHTLPPA
jgi:hypothetical protein